MQLPGFPNWCKPMRSAGARANQNASFWKANDKIVLHQRTKLEMYIAYVKYELCQKIDPDHVTRLSRVTVAMNCTFFLLCHFNSRV